MSAALHTAVCAMTPAIDVGGASSLVAGRMILVAFKADFRAAVAKAYPCGKKSLRWGT